MKSRFWSLWVLMIGMSPPFAGAAYAAPAEVMIIRHAEKPDTGDDLNSRGYERAEKLVGFFETSPEVTRYGTPVAIYATAPEHEDSSQRPIETVTPLARALGLKINENFTKKEAQGLVGDILNNPAYDGRVVLICSEHKAIPGMVQDFGWDAGPSKWPGDSFDRVWVLELGADGKAKSFQDLSQDLLPGDSKS